MVVFGVIGVILACLYLWWLIRFEGNWSYLTQAPPDIKQLVAGANGIVYIQNQKDQLYSCSSRVMEECWIPDALPDSLPKFQTCDKRQPAFMFFSKPPKDINYCIQYDERGPEFGSFNILALNNNGEVWLWEHSTNASLLFFIPFVVFLAGLLGMILGGIIWLVYRLLNNRAGKVRISNRQLVFILIPWTLLACIIVGYVAIFPLPVSSSTRSKRLAEFTAIVGTFEAQLTASATERSAQVPRGTQPPGYDLIAVSCQARWHVSFDEIACPDNAFHKKSPFIANPGDYSLKGGTLTGAALVMPVGSKAQFMEAEFPRMKIQENEHFRSTVGCLDMGDACNVYFEVSYITDSGDQIALGRVRSSDDGNPANLDLDLSHLAGKAVNIRLYVYTYNDAKNQYPLWVNPTIGP